MRRMNIVRNEPLRIILAVDENVRQTLRRVAITCDSRCNEGSRSDDLQNSVLPEIQETASDAEYLFTEILRGKHIQL